VYAPECPAVADANDLATDIAQQAVEPASTTSDGQSATGRPVADLIAADQYLAQKAARAKRRRGIYFSQLVTPGAGGGGCGEPFDRPCGGG
jgi:hypothetical protein